MSFVEVDKSVKKEKWSMIDLHSHPHYEVFFLTKGKRKYFLSNALYTLSKPTIIVIPPHAMHKSEDDAFERYVLSVSENYLDKFQKHVLKQKEFAVIELSDEENKKFVEVFEKLIAVDKHKKYSDDVIHTLVSYLILQISELDDKRSKPSAQSDSAVPTTILKIIEYLNAHYQDKITLDTISELFFISKGTLIYNFNKYMDCTPIDFLVNIRLAKAKELLLNTKLSIEEIAEKCGFSSANYFGLIFKKKEKLSPMNYKKHENNKK